MLTPLLFAEKGSLPHLAAARKQEVQENVQDTDSLYSNAPATTVDAKIARITGRQPKEESNGRSRRGSSPERVGSPSKAVPALPGTNPAPPRSPTKQVLGKKREVTVEHQQMIDEVHIPHNCLRVSP